MMKHDLEEQLEELERQGISRRHFLKILTAAGITTAVGTQKLTHSQVMQKERS